MVDNKLLTPANMLTLGRLICAPLLVFLILQSHWWASAACMIFAIASDTLDGICARRLNQASRLGGIFDHATDAIFVSSGCWALAQLGLINAWLWAFIAAAFTQYLLDSGAITTRSLRASWLGRINGIAYFALMAIVVSSMLPLLAEQLNLMLRQFGLYFSWLLLATTIFSMLDRFYSQLTCER